MLDRVRQLIDILEQRGPRLLGAEVGVWQGHVAGCLLRELPGLVLWLIDPWSPYEGNDWTGAQTPQAFERARSQALWRTAHAAGRRRVLPVPSREAAGLIGARSLDFVFIDANHRYESVAADLALWWPNVKPRGLLAGHDYDPRGDRPGLGVRRAVDQFAAARKRSVSLGLDGVWWIEKPP